MAAITFQSTCCGQEAATAELVADAIDRLRALRNSSTHPETRWSQMHHQRKHYVVSNDENSRTVETNEATRRRIGAPRGKGPSNRHEIWYFGESELGAVRIDDYKYRFIDQPGGWLGDKTKPDVPYLINLRLDPFERTSWPNSGTKEGAQQYFDWFKYEFWRFVFV
jgi:hypothetical protein